MAKAIILINLISLSKNMDFMAFQFHCPKKKLMS